MKEHHKIAKRAIQTLESVEGEMGRLRRRAEDPLIETHAVAALRSLATAKKHITAMLKPEK